MHGKLDAFVGGGGDQLDNQAVCDNVVCRFYNGKSKRNRKRRTGWNKKILLDIKN